MRAKDAKTIPIVDYLSREGFQPAKQRMNGKELWYSSPLRPGDSTPSFKVDTELNVWFDHGMAEGGNILDLVCLLQNVTIKRALAILDETGLLTTSRPNQPPNKKNVKTSVVSKSAVQKHIFYENNQGNSNSAAEKEKNGSLQICSIAPIRHPALLQYLDSRKISHYVAGMYLKEIHFKSQQQSHEFFALGWPNGDGYEARSSLFKGFVGTGKDISRINLNDGKTLSIFEGFFDFLAYLSHHETDKLQNSVIVLNSVALKKRALAEIAQYSFSKVYLFLDNDEAGRLTATFYQQAIKEIPVVDKSPLYADYKDYNEMRMKTLKA